MANPDQDLATTIATALSLTVGTDVFYGRVHPPEDGIAHKAVFIVPTGGPKPLNYLGTLKVHRRSTFQIRVRADQDDFDGGLIFARQVRDAVHHAAIAGYQEVEIQESEPNPLPYSNRGYPEFTLNVEMQFDDTV